MIIKDKVEMKISKQNVMDAVELWLAQHFKIGPKVTDIKFNSQYGEADYTVTFEHEKTESEATA